MGRFATSAHGARQSASVSLVEGRGSLESSEVVPTVDSTTSSATDTLEDLALEGRWSELERLLSTSDASSETLLYKGLLALARGGPIDDAILAAEASLRESEPDATLVAGTVRLAARLGAHAIARDIASRAAEKTPESEPLALATEQLGAAPHAGASREEWELERAIHARDLPAVRRALAATHARSPTPSWAAQADAHLALREQRYADAAAALRTAATTAASDDAPALEVAAALAAWAAGDAGAIDALRRVRDEGSEPAAGPPSVPKRVASSVLCALDRDPDAVGRGPRWRMANIPAGLLHRDGPPARAALAYALDALASKPEAELEIATSMAQLRRAFDARGVATLRVRADDTTIERVLEEGALLVLEEERPTESGYPFVVGIEPVAGLVLLHQPEAFAPELLDLERLRRRTRLFDDGALVVAGAGEAGKAVIAKLDALGVREDEVALAVDRAVMGPDGSMPPRAHIAALAADAIARSLDAQILHRVRGEALLDIAQAERSDRARNDLRRWYAEARERFPESEWPFQIHARALELDGAWEEAGIAWIDAAMRDPDDHRNALGAARARIGFGDTQSAERAIRRALRLDPANVEALARGALLASWRDDHDTADIRSKLAVELGPVDPFALGTRVTVLEREGALDDATVALRAALGTGHAAFGERLVHRLVHGGVWEEARERALAIARAEPGNPDAWALAARAAYGAGDREGATSTALSGLRSAGPSRDLVDVTADAIAAFHDDPAATAKSDELATALLVYSPESTLDAASQLAFRGRTAQALEVCARVDRAQPDAANPAWRTAQLLLSYTDDVERAVALLEKTVERADHFAPAHVLLGWAVVDADPERAAALAQHPAVRGAPALGWPLLARALETRGDSAEAAAVRDRLAALDSEALRSGISLIAGSRLLGRARTLLDELLARAPDDATLAIALANAEGQAGDAHAEHLRLMAIEEKRPGTVPLPMLVRAAEAALDLTALARFAERLFDAGRRPSGRGFADVWVEAGRHAAAALATGDEAPRTALLAGAGRHPLALFALARIERAAGHARADEDAKSLSEVAPGARIALDAGARP